LTFKNEIRICKICNKEFQPNQHNQKYCSNTCGKIKLSAVMFICKICEEEFKPNSANQRTCSKKCRHNSKNQNWRIFYKRQKSYEPKKKILCSICKKEFIRANRRQKECGKDCRKVRLRKNALEKYYRDKNKILERRKNNIEYCILNKLRMRISCAIKSQGAYKATKTIKLVGCSVKELKEYIEKQFTDGMNWDNYGKKGWHIDHILPCAGFNLIEKEEQQKCFHYTNLQPLWAQENLSKNCKVEV